MKKGLNAIIDALLIIQTGGTILFIIGATGLVLFSLLASFLSFSGISGDILSEWCVRVILGYVCTMVVLEMISRICLKIDAHLK